MAFPKQSENRSSLLVTLNLPRDRPICIFELSPTTTVPVELWITVWYFEAIKREICRNLPTDLRNTPAHKPSHAHGHRGINHFKENSIIQGF